MKHLDEFITHLGVDEELKTTLSAEDLPEGVTIEDLANKLKSSIGAVHAAQTGKSFTKEDVNGQFSVYKKTQSATLNKEFELGLSRNEAEEISPEEMRKKIKDKYKALITQAEKDAGIDETKQEMITNLTSTNEEITGKYNDLQSTMEATIAKIQGEAKQEVKSAFASLAFTTEWSKKNLPAHLKDSEEIFREKFMEKILSVYDSDIKGNITDKEGNEAINFDKNGIWKHISEPLDYLWKKHSLEAVSNGGGSGSFTKVAGGEQTQVSDKVKAMRERAMKARS